MVTTSRANEGTLWALMARVAGGPAGVDTLPRQGAGTSGDGNRARPAALIGLYLLDGAWPRFVTAFLGRNKEKQFAA